MPTRHVDPASCPPAGRRDFVPCMIGSRFGVATQDAAAPTGFIVIELCDDLEAAERLAATWTASGLAPAA